MYELFTRPAHDVQSTGDRRATQNIPPMCPRTVTAPRQPRHMTSANSATSSRHIQVWYPQENAYPWTAWTRLSHSCNATRRLVKLLGCSPPGQLLAGARRGANLKALATGP